MDKIDLSRELRYLYSASARNIKLVEVPQLQFLMIDGYGDPNSTPSFQEDINSLYSLSHTIKMTFKKMAKGKDFKVMPLEGLWWMDDLHHKNDWKWTLMILQPKFVTETYLDHAKDQVYRKKKLSSLDHVRLERLDEGKAVQILHVGPYSQEGSAIGQLHDYMADNGYTSNGKHHEIYLSDPKRVSPDRWKTILRQPVK